MSKNTLGDRMKAYEMREAGRRTMERLPVCVRLDGRAFHSVTKNAEKPHDMTFIGFMLDVTNYLIRDTGALIGYTQSDEISLIFHTEGSRSQMFFDRRIMKMTSVIAAMATAELNHLMLNHPGWRNIAIKKLPQFDCRVWNVPSKEEAANAILWRVQDARRNSILSTGQANFSHNALHGKDTCDILAMLAKKEVDWNAYPLHVRYGAFIQRRKTIRRFTVEELTQLPPKHQAHSDPDLEVERSDIRLLLDMPYFGDVKNRVEVIFEGAEPLKD